MNERTPTYLDLEEPIDRALGVAASLHGCDPEYFNLDGLEGAVGVLYDELRQIKRIYHAAYEAGKGGAA